MPRARIQSVRKHLVFRGAHVPAPEEMHDDLRSLVRGCEDLRAKGPEYAEIELSPYMRSLLQISGLGTESRRPPARREACVVAGV